MSRVYQNANVIEQSRSFVEVVNFEDYGSETFAQPREEPIPADSQELYSSQIELHNETAGSCATTHLQQHLQTSGSPTHERFSTSACISRQDIQRSLADAIPETSPQRQDRAYLHALTLQNDVAVSNDSWQTQPTLPWCPSWSKCCENLQGYI